MITPTVGRVVLYRPNPDEEHGSLPGLRLAAQIAFVHEGATQVNLGILDPNGVHFSRTGVILAQDREAQPGECEWMPYQRAVAAGEIPPTQHA